MVYSNSSVFPKEGIPAVGSSFTGIDVEHSAMLHSSSKSTERETGRETAKINVTIRMWNHVTYELHTVNVFGILYSKNRISHDHSNISHSLKLLHQNREKHLWFLEISKNIKGQQRSACSVRRDIKHFWWYHQAITNLPQKLKRVHVYSSYIWNYNSQILYSKSTGYDLSAPDFMLNS